MNLKGLSKEDAAKLIYEKLDSEQTILVCKRHMYTGQLDTPPQDTRCRDCMHVWWTQRYFSLPPSMRTEFLEQMLEIAHKANEDVEKGRFDIQLYRHANLKKEIN